MRKIQLTLSRQHIVAYNDTARSLEDRIASIIQASHLKKRLTGKWLDLTKTANENVRVFKTVDYHHVSPLGLGTLGKLPVEIRAIVWSHLVTEVVDSTEHTTMPSFAIGTLGGNELLTCRELSAMTASAALHNEIAASLYFREAIFCIRPDSDDKIEMVEGPQNTLREVDFKSLRNMPLCRFKSIKVYIFPCEPTAEIISLIFKALKLVEVLNRKRCEPDHLNKGPRKLEVILENDWEDWVDDDGWPNESLIELKTEGTGLIFHPYDFVLLLLPFLHLPRISKESKLVCPTGFKNWPHGEIPSLKYIAKCVQWKMKGSPYERCVPDPHFTKIYGSNDVEISEVIVNVWEEIARWEAP